ncbi:hypothetical protein P5G51_006900 [Virgibacillus sp. 179-BFC.A HS]|uniref:DUF4340 domain-containing protein n=1 Tax=Tigheibacillus jepli TaxID=3035914 RepID=A0ABU5CFT6_9BACI|nr:hypothetical protein [Virgibacillus sp. 179-BFC.A HS]MDY0405166.1 hypothetical protein [Virgibacillus sp. 179-BFC.A HS]
MTYQKGFPKTKTRALIEFIGQQASQQMHFLYKEDNQCIYAKIPTKNDREVPYYRYEDAQLNDYVGKYLQTKLTPKTFKALRVDMKENLFQGISNKAIYNLPQISMENDNVLHVKTKTNERDFDLVDVLKEYKVKKTDKIIYEVTALTDEAFQLYVKDMDLSKTSKTDMTLFIKQDLSDIVVTQLYPGKLDKALDKNNLILYKSLLTKLDADRYLVKSASGYRILDYKSQQLKSVDDNDYLSLDGKYVYINGNKKDLQEGEQRIQTIENYLKGNDKYEREFNLSFKKIAKKLKLDTSGVSSASINYFNKDFVVIRLNFSGVVVGKAGATNVIIDLQEKNPTAYIVDLGLE